VRTVEKKKLVPYIPLVSWDIEDIVGDR